MQSELPSSSLEPFVSPLSPYPLPYRVPYRLPYRLPYRSQVWHNYGFDRHVLENMGVCCRGFGGEHVYVVCEGRVFRGECEKGEIWSGDVVKRRDGAPV